jgi:tRNA pseudouridine55 synthase
MTDAPAGPTGVLIIDKPAGWTSMDVCASVRARLRRGGAPKRIKVGHAGTLDPFATGLLVVLVGKATRRCEEFMASRKRYLGVVDLAHSSTTDDPEGDLTPVSGQRPPSADDVARAAACFEGTIMQKPPAFSALHVGGRRAYDLARQGRPPDLPARPVQVFRCALTRFEFPLVHVDIECGKGTYIRSIARDLGAALGWGGMLRELRRVASGDFTIDAARTMDSLPDPLTQADLSPLD